MIIKEPESENSSLHNGNVTFDCTVMGEALVWYVDQQLSDSPDIENRRITRIAYIETGMQVQSNLSIPAEMNNNNTKVKCVGLSNGTTVNSSNAFLRLQGKAPKIVLQALLTYIHDNMLHVTTNPNI